LYKEGLVHVEGFPVLASEIMQIKTFWLVTPFNSIQVQRYSGEHIKLEK
jgi:hypothetical protein